MIGFTFIRRRTPRLFYSIGNVRPDFLSAPQARQRRRWLLGGTIAMRMGIWSIHFASMMAQFTKRRPHIAGDAGTGGNTDHEPS
ncbi:hypothetical protein SAMN05446635_0601 [Burkholderia sp. OK233]|nr:hypothetical protein SAMN05446635_0601 [Burkholderia sp. OK233]